MRPGPQNVVRSIDASSPLPYYHQLASILRDELEQGTWQVDELLPSEGQLTVMFGVSRSVTRRALEMLEGEGLVLRIKGKGTVVTKPKVSLRASPIAARWHHGRNSPVRLERMIDAGRVAAGTNLGRLLDVAAGDDVWELRLVESSDGVPASLVEMYLKVYGTLTVTAPPRFDVGGPGIYGQLATKYGVEVTDSDIEIEVVEASKVESSFLDVTEGSPLVQVSSLDFSTLEVVGFTRMVTRTDRFFLSVAVHGQNAERHSFGAPKDALKGRGQSLSEL